MEFPKTPGDWESLIEQAVARDPEGSRALVSGRVRVWYKRSSPARLWVYLDGDPIGVGDECGDALMAICSRMPVRPRTDPVEQRSFAHATDPLRSDAYELAMERSAVRSATLAAARRRERTRWPDLDEFLESVRSADAKA